MKDKKWLKVFLWIFFFPIMLIIYISKNEKMNKKTKGFLIAIVVLFSLAVGASEDTVDVSESADVVMGDEVQEEINDESIIPLNEFEEKVVKAFSGEGTELTYLRTTTLVDGEKGSIQVGISNDTLMIEIAIKMLAEHMITYEIQDTMEVMFKNSESEEELLVTFELKPGGEYNILEKGINYKTFRENWVENQFDLLGKHYEFNNLIKKNLNDEKSFEHIETSCIDVIDEATADLANGIFKENGYSQRVSVGDLVITVQFSGKNAFNATVKNTAIGIIYYELGTMELVAIE